MVGQLTLIYVDTFCTVIDTCPLSSQQMIGIDATFKDDGDVDIVNTNVAGYAGPSIEVDVVAVMVQARQIDGLLIILRQHHLKIL